MITTITIEANTEQELFDRIDQIKDAIKNGDYTEQMDGTFQVDTSNIDPEFLYTETYEDKVSKRITSIPLGH
jgi:hypothetical protein